MDGKKNKKQFSCLFLGLFGPIALCEGKGASRPTAAGQRSLRDRALLCDPPRIQDVGARGYGLGLQVEGELPLLSERGIAHLHRQAPITGAPAVQAQITPHVSQFGVILDLFPFLQHTHAHTQCINTHTDISHWSKTMLSYSSYIRYHIALCGRIVSFLLLFIIPIIIIVDYKNTT